MNTEKEYHEKSEVRREGKDKQNNKAGVVLTNYLKQALKVGNVASTHFVHLKMSVSE